MRNNFGHFFYPYDGYEVHNEFESTVHPIRILNFAETCGKWPSPSKSQPNVEAERAPSKKTVSGSRRRKKRKRD